MQYSDETIISLLRSQKQKENDNGLKVLYQKFSPMISQFISSNSGTTEDVEDVFQDAILVLYNQVNKSDFVLTCQLKTYFYSICRNLWLKRLNRQKIKTLDLQEHEEFIDVEPSSFKAIEQTEEKTMMLKLLSNLGDDCQKMLLLFYYNRLRMREIAVRMNFANEQVARNKKVKCLKKLTAIMEKSPSFIRFFK